MTSSLNRRQTLALRSLDTIYAHFGLPLTVTLPDGTVLEGQLAKVDIREVEEGLDGASIEMDVKGFTARFRRHKIPETVLAANQYGFPSGTRFKFAAPFLGHTYFKVDALSQSYNRDGGQIIVQMTSTNAPAAPAAEDTDTPEGLPFS